jgi:hypothetical protein
MYMPEEYGLVQLMTDLRADGFQPLRPQDLREPGRLRLMWNAFVAIVETTLIPLAEEEIIHMDIRPGYDHTANLLYQEKDGVGTIRMIDLESLISFSAWLRLNVSNKRYIPNKIDKGVAKVASALEFVLRLVVCTAEVWSKHTNSSDVNTSDIIAASYKQKMAAELTAAPCDREFIVKQLAELSKQESFPEKPHPSQDTTATKKQRVCPTNS